MIAQILPVNFESISDLPGWFQDEAMRLKERLTFPAIGFGFDGSRGWWLSICLVRLTDRLDM